MGKNNFISRKEYEKQKNQTSVRFNSEKDLDELAEAYTRMQKAWDNSMKEFKNAGYMVIPGKYIFNMGKDKDKGKQFQGTQPTKDWVPNKPQFPTDDKDKEE